MPFVFIPIWEFRLNGTLKDADVEKGEDRGDCELSGRLSAHHSSGWLIPHPADGEFPDRCSPPPTRSLCE